MCALDSQRGEQSLTVEGVALDGPGARDRTAAGVTAAVIQDESIRALKWGLIGQGPELVGGQSCLDQHYRLTGAAKFDLQHRVGNGDTTRLKSRTLPSRSR